MTGITTFASHRILNFLLGRTAFTVPASFFIGLSTTPLGDDGAGFTEPVDPMYTRIQLPNNNTSFAAAASRVSVIIREYMHQPSSVAWGRCTHFMLFDAAVGGNIWFYGELQHSLDVEIETSPWLRANTNELMLDICGGSTSEMAISISAANAVLNHLFGRTPILTPPPIWFMGVSSTPMNADGIGATEPTGGGYARLQLLNDKNTFTVAANKSITLAQEFGFPTATTPWGNMTHFFISDAATGGNIWWSGRLVHSRNVEVATTLMLIPEGFNWILDNCIDVVSPSP